MNRDITVIYRYQNIQNDVGINAYRIRIVSEQKTNFISASDLLSKFPYGQAACNDYHFRYKRVNEKENNSVNWVDIQSQNDKIPVYNDQVFLKILKLNSINRFDLKLSRQIQGAGQPSPQASQQHPYYATSLEQLVQPQPKANLSVQPQPQIPTNQPSNGKQPAQNSPHGGSQMQQIQPKEPSQVTIEDLTNKFEAQTKVSPKNPLDDAKNGDLMNFNDLHEPSNESGQTNELEHTEKPQEDFFFEQPTVKPTQVKLDKQDIDDVNLLGQPDNLTGNNGSQEPSQLRQPPQQTQASNLLPEEQKQTIKKCDGEEQKSVLDLIKEDEIRKELKQEASITQRPKIREWAFNNNEKKNIRSLLSSLEDILWEDSGWVPLSLSDLLDENLVKKAYQKAIRIVHPDKNQRTQPERRYIAEQVFQYLNEAFKVRTTG